jgi:prevent-host-death family protein
MSQQEVTITDFRKNLAAHIEGKDQQTLFIMKRGRPVAVILSPEEYSRLSPSKAKEEKRA